MRAEDNNDVLLHRIEINHWQDHSDACRHSLVLEARDYLEIIWRLSHGFVLHDGNLLCLDLVGCCCCILFPLPSVSLFMDNLIYLPFLRPANEVSEGYVFTGVCLSTGRVGVYPIVSNRGQRLTPPGRQPPAQCMLGYGQQAGGTHSTGMHSCVTFFRFGSVGS